MAASVERSIHACQDAQLQGKLLTTNYSHYMTSSIADSVESNTSDVTYQTGLVAHGSPIEAIIPPFVFPIVMDSPEALKGRKEKIIVGDGRPFMAVAREGTTPCRVINLMEFELLHVLLATNHYWLSKSPSNLLVISPVLTQVYCRWVGDTISKRFELDLTQRQVLRVVTAYFFLCCFINDMKLNDEQKRSMVAQACRAAGVQVAEFEHVLSGVEVIESAEDYVAVVQRVLSTPRMDNFNLGLLAQIIMGTWFGFNGRQLATAAIEHPPTFAALLYMSFAQNSYKKTGLSMVSEAYKGSRGGSEFVRNMQLQLGLR